MNKPEQVRTLLLSAVPHLKRNPNDLQLFVDQGKVVATGAGRNLSFEYQFNVIVLVTDYADHADTIMVPLLAWVAQHQPELITNPDKRENGIKFRAEMINKKQADIEVTLPLTERVKVTPVDGGRTVEHLPEPIDPYSEFDWSLFVTDTPMTPPGGE